MSGLLLNPNVVDFGGLIEVTPTNDPTQDPVNVQLAIDTAPSGGLINLMAGTFDFGTQTVTSSANGMDVADTGSRSGIIVKKGLNIRGAGTGSTTIVGGIGQDTENLSGVFQLYLEDTGTKQKIELSNIKFSGSAIAVGLVRPNRELVHEGANQLIYLHNLKIDHPVPITKPDNVGTEDANIYYTGITGYAGGQSMVHIDMVDVDMTNVAVADLEAHTQSNGGAIELRTMLGANILANITTTGSNARVMLTRHQAAVDAAYNEMRGMTNDYHLPNNNPLGPSTIAVPRGRMHVNNNTFRIKLTSGSSHPAFLAGMSGLDGHLNYHVAHNRFESENPHCTAGILGFKSVCGFNIYRNTISGTIHSSSAHIVVDAQGDFDSVVLRFKTNHFSGSSGRLYKLMNGKATRRAAIIDDRDASFVSSSLPYFIGSGSVDNDFVIPAGQGAVEFGDAAMGHRRNRIRKP